MGVCEDRRFPMKVSSTSGVSQTGGANGARGVGGGGSGFRLPPVSARGGVSQTNSVSNVAGVMGVDALLALQETGSATDRRRRSVARGGRILDELDGMKVALLGGEISMSDLERMRRALREERAATDDPKLEDLLDQIETRALVEMAKLEVAARAA
jgi:hypothetical protein